MKKRIDFAPSTTGRRWLAVMGRIYDDETLAVVQHYAVGIAMMRHGRQVTRDDLNAALDKLGEEAESWPQE